MTKIFCDNCGSEISESRNHFIITIKEHYKNEIDEDVFDEFDIDLCDACNKKWIEMRDSFLNKD